MQAWDSVLVTKADDKYTGQAGCVTRVDRADPAAVKVTVRMDVDSVEAAFLDSDLKRLG
jgi:hypothetical protein